MLSSLIMVALLAQTPDGNPREPAMGGTGFARPKEPRMGGNDSWIPAFPARPLLARMQPPLPGGLIRVVDSEGVTHYRTAAELRRCKPTLTIYAAYVPQFNSDGSSQMIPFYSAKGRR